MYVLDTCYGGSFLKPKLNKSFPCFRFGISFKINLVLYFGFKSALSDLRQFLAESLLKLMKNAFHFNSKALFVLKILTFLSWLFVHAAKRLNYKDKVNFKIYDVTAWLTDNCDTHIPQYLEVKTIRQWSLVS